MPTYKGMESDVVLMVDVNLDHGAYRPKSMYVAFSRAKHRLSVWVKPGQVERMRAVVEEI